MSECQLRGLSSREQQFAGLIRSPVPFYRIFPIGSYESFNFAQLIRLFTEIDNAGFNGFIRIWDYCGKKSASSMITISLSSPMSSPHSQVQLYGFQINKISAAVYQGFEVRPCVGFVGLRRHRMLLHDPKAR